MANPKPPGWLTNKIAPIPSKYEAWDRACETYNAWLSGFLEEEISEHFGLSLDEVKRDIREIQLTLPARIAISHGNDRNRLLVQREESMHYRDMLHKSLTTPVETLLRSGISPSGLLREFREATGQVVDKSMNIALQTNYFPMRSGGHGDMPMGSSGVTSAEDLIRKVVSTLDTGETLGAAINPEEACDMEAPEPRDVDVDADSVDDDDYEDDDSED